MRETLSFALRRPVGKFADPSDSCFADRLGRFVDLTTAECEALARLEERPRQLRRGAVLLRANDKGTELFVLRRGVLMSFVLLDYGSRQILRFHFPGDMLGWTALAYRTSPETLVALTEAEVCPFDRSALSTLAVEHPRLFAATLALNQMERQALTDRLAGLGRTSARGRVAALLIEIRDRLRQANSAITDTFPLGLTQEEIGDATGLTSVHVNRMLRQLEDEMLIARENGRVTLVDETALAHVANYIDRSHTIDLNWLPPSR
jgi:CRP/FNR family transcriptional regulator, anaerobic regulatory protein